MLGSQSSCSVRSAQLTATLLRTEDAERYNLGVVIFLVFLGFGFLIVSVREPVRPFIPVYLELFPFFGYS